jgi:hypothetical protein
MADLEKELFEALKWALPLAEIAMESHRQERLRCGHTFGTKRAGLYDEEVDEIERFRSTLNKAIHNGL